MAAEWAQATNGEVTLQVYHNGTAGNEQDVLRKLRLNQIQAGVFSTIGLTAITPEIITLSVPFLIRNDGELEVVLNSLKADLEKKIDEKGFFTLAWARAGWIKIFSRTPVFVPGDLKRQTLGTDPGEEQLMQAFKAMGYKMEPVSMNDTLIALNSRKIDAIYQSPIAVGGYQFFGIVKNMTSINIAPFMGGIIMNRTAWRSIPDQYKPRLLEITKQIEREIDTSIFRLEDEAIETMKKYGLTIHQTDAQQEQEWFTDAARAMPSLLGSTFDRDIYEKINAILTNYRNGR
jgi:TRAP-type C4-dicarboxylate transport system substrate-binding protein